MASIDAIPAHSWVIVLLVTALVCGISLCTLAHCLRWLIFSDEGWTFRKRINWTFVVVSFLILALNVVALVLICWQLERRVIHLESVLTSTNYHTPSWVELIKCASFNSVALLADSILIYRCWHLYGKSVAVVAFPATLWVGGVACTAIQAYLQVSQAYEGDIGSYSWGPVSMAFGPGIVPLSYLASTGALNVYCIFVLIYRIHKVAKQTKEFSSIRNLRYIIRILAESGSLYLSVTLGHSIAWITANDMAIEVLSNINMTVLSIAFHLVIIRSAQNRIESDENRESQHISTLRFHSVSMTVSANSILMADDSGRARSLKD
ncbi:hypothetical protein P691DRAFT_183165 [Macrolepiota fuliginosa MF-IS2]|uniref:Uncharacterized protein n=1 Tax=Macrolepiota fuliginosa MF-IS2 TaxID=1400762 RepID=A0A9P6BZP8_9AGAR|nr:hypothetical protein P691DRAFT_183165 [Macrolepiota fuliginosa MF-IS2]